MREDGVGRGDQTALHQRTVLAPGGRIFGEELLQAGDRIEMRLLDVDEQRPRAGIAAARDRIIGRRDAVDRRAFELARILFQIRIAEDAERVGIGLELLRSEEHTSELQSLMRISYAVFCLKKKNKLQKKQRTILR